MMSVSIWQHSKTITATPFPEVFEFRMPQFEPGLGGLSRAVIAGVIAWLLAFQGFGAFASLHGHWAQQTAGQTDAQERGSNCGAAPSSAPSVPCHHGHCECCIVCASGHIGWLTRTGSIVSAVVFSLPRVGGIPTEGPFSRVATKPTSGWTSSWSQRAPPHFY